MTEVERNSVARSWINKLSLLVAAYGAWNAAKILHEIERQLKEGRLNEQRGRDSTEG